MALNQVQEGAVSSGPLLLSGLVQFPFAEVRERVIRFPANGNVAFVTAGLKSLLTRSVKPDKATISETPAVP